jgi:type IV secretion system protein VirB6
MQGGIKLIFLILLSLAAIIIMVVLWIIALVGAVDITDGCFYRYNLNEDNSVSSASSIVNSVTLKANGNYTVLSSNVTSGVALDPNTYGKWLNTNLRVNSGQKVDLDVKGEVSLCKAYVPAYNLQQESDRDIAGDLIEIPRVEDKSSPPVNLIFDAKVGEWRNLTQVFNNDHIVVSIHPDKKTVVGNSSIYNNIQKRVDSFDCTEGNQSYNPICGRYSIWDNSANYVDNCEYIAECYECNHRLVCHGLVLLGLCFSVSDAGLQISFTPEWDWCSCYGNVLGAAPEPYKNDGKYTAPWLADADGLIMDTAPQCNTNRAYVEGAWQNEKYFWFSADSATGLLNRFDSNENPSNKTSRGSGFSYSEISDDQSALDAGADYKVLRDQIYVDSDVAYLQYRFHDSDNSFADNTGGYVLNIKQTKCRRENGSALNDTFEARGAVQYIIGGYGKDPNIDMSGMSVSNILLDANGTGSITAPWSEEGYLWLKINNDPDDYQDSFGQYRVDFKTKIDQANFFNDVLNPFFEGFKGKVKGASVQIFKNMTCYGQSDTSNCTNYFNYIKGLLSLYIMIYGMMFLIGMVQISQTDLVIRVIKIAFVAGLMNESTFEFFNIYVFEFVTGFTDSIISNMAGYSLFSGSSTVSNPFMFLNEVLTKVFLSSTFISQVLALLSMGINGVIYFILIFICLAITVIVLLRSIAVYLMAFMAITLLIGLSPLFLTFILFEKTFYLFDNWVKFTFRYMLEPVILLAGIIILTQLFTIYLDFVIGYSVCWKCVLPFKLPFISIPGITPAFLDVELFCIHWFAPWGFDYRSSQMGLNIQNMIVLMIISYCMWGYIEFSESIVARLSGAAGPSATGMGGKMSGKIEEKARSKVGLDSKSVAQLRGKIEGGLKKIGGTDKTDSIDASSRKDAGGTNDNKSGGESGFSSDAKGKVSEGISSGLSKGSEGISKGAEGLIDGASSVAGGGSGSSGGSGGSSGGSGGLSGGSGGSSGGSGGSSGGSGGSSGGSGGLSGGSGGSSGGSGGSSGGSGGSSGGSGGLSGGSGGSSGGSGGSSGGSGGSSGKSGSEKKSTKGSKSSGKTGGFGSVSGAKRSKKSIKTMERKRLDSERMKQKESEELEKEKKSSDDKSKLESKSNKSNDKPDSDGSGDEGKE